MTHRVLIGRGIGAAALVVGVAAVAIGSGALGLVAGILAVAGVLVATVGPSNAPPTEPVVDRSELDALRTRLGELERTLEDERQQHDTTRQNLAEYLAGSPPAGSFDRKFFDQTRDGSALEFTDPSDIRLLADPETNLFSEAYFRVSLDARIASARRHLRPVAIALVSVIDGDANGGGPPTDPAQVTAAVRQTLRDADTACRLADGSYALILEDTPENGAVWTVERIRRNLNTRHGVHTMWAGVACYPAHAFSTDELLDQATTALASAQEWMQDRIEIATAD